MAWLQLKLATCGVLADKLAAHLEALGALAVTYAANEALEQPIFDEPDHCSATLWEQLELTALFEETHDLQPVLTALREQYPEIDPPTVERLPEQDWYSTWKDRFVPLCFGERLWVVPSWHEPPDTAAVNVFIDPGMAFGTGTHATTALCLEWLVGQDALTGGSVLDYGCGSGILAIAAAKLGARRVHGVDIDKQALKVAADNARANQVDVAFLLPAELQQFHSDYLVANILLEPLISLASEMANLLPAGGKIALSGLLWEQVDACKTAYQQWFDFTDCYEREGWGLLAGSRRTAA